MNLELKILQPNHLQQFKKDMQDAFQQGAVEGLGETDEQILPESHIESSLRTPGAVAYEALVDGEMVGGAIVVIDQETCHNHLHFLYVKNGVHSKGIGLAIWQAIELRHPETKVWETVTPYFERRNLHFYVNKCGFAVTEFFNKYHPDPNDPAETYQDGYWDGMLKFQKKMQ